MTFSSRSTPLALPLLLLAVLFSRLISLYSFYLFDDAFITFRYAANLAAGHGFVYNLGERVQGISAPLWGFILAVPQTLGWNIEWASRLIAIAADMLTAWLVIEQFRNEGWPRAGMFAAFLLGLDLYLSKTAVGGMESSLFLLMTVGAVILVLTGRRNLAASVAALSCFVRPEGVLFALALLAFVWIEERHFPLKPAILGAAIILCGAALQWGYYGDLIPQSVRGKMALERSLESVWSLVVFPKTDPLQAMLTITTILGLPVAWKSSRFIRAYGLWSLALLVSWIVTGAHLWYWYCVPVWFFKVLVTSIAIARWSESRALLRTFVNLLSPIMMLVIVVTVWCILAIVRGPDGMEKNVYSKIRAWSRGQDFSGQSAYGMDFGAFGYYAKLRMLDEPGLVWPPAITRYHNDLKAILLGERPEWAMVTNVRDNVAAMRSPELASLYQPLWRASMAGDTVLTPDLAAFSPAWRPDFTLYRRVALGR
jgi:hypothetical protein